MTYKGIKVTFFCLTNIDPLLTCTIQHIVCRARTSDWGVSKSSTINIYAALSILSIRLWLCCRRFYRKNLTKEVGIQAQALRLCCGALKTTPMSALQVEFGEMPLYL